jgi:hypothetical protein
VALHAFYPGKRPAKQVQRVNDKGGSGEATHSGSTLIAAIAKYSPSCLLMSSVPPKLTVFSAVSREAKADTAPSNLRDATSR